MYKTRFDVKTRLLKTSIHRQCDVDSLSLSVQSGHVAISEKNCVTVSNIFPNNNITQNYNEAFGKRLTSHVRQLRDTTDTCRIVYYMIVHLTWHAEKFGVTQV